MSDKPKEQPWVDTQAMAPRMLSRDEIGALQQMFTTEGWRVWMSLCKIESDAAAMAGLDLVGKEENRILNRAVFHVRCNDLTFERRLTDLLRTAPETFDEADEIPELPVPLPTPMYRRIMDYLRL